MHNGRRFSGSVAALALGLGALALVLAALHGLIPPSASPASPAGAERAAAAAPGAVTDTLPYSVTLPLVLRQAAPMRVITGTYVRLGHPCTSDPCLPGLVEAVQAEGTPYYVTVGGAWLWWARPWDGYGPEIGDPVRVSGDVSARADVLGDPFYEIEVVSLERAAGPPGATAAVVISEVVATSDGEGDPGEYVEICSEEAQPVPLEGWTLRSGARRRSFAFPAYGMEPGQCCRVYTNEQHPAWCGFSFESDVDVWGYAHDCAYLWDGEGRLVDAACHCMAHSATLTLEATARALEVGQPLTVTATLFNHGCTLVGVPKYTLEVASDGPGPVLTPVDPEPVIHMVGLGPGQGDAAAFALQAAGAGEAALRADVSYEVHVGYPGPAYWGWSSTGPLTITVTP